LAHRVAHGAAADEVAAALVDAWRDVDASLRPIIGQGGVVALFNRCRWLTAQDHAWLAAVPHEPAAGLDLRTLQTLFAGQPAAVALACGNDMLQRFHELLSSLIGTPLTDRLLRRAWTRPGDTSTTLDART
jgi:hypothetical protein